MEDRFEIHLFTPEGRSGGSSCETEWINRFLRAGLDRLHVRKPGFSLEETENYVKEIDRRFHNRLVLHDHPGLALRYGCGFQFNRRNPAVEGAFRSMSFSCHSIEEVMSHTSSDFVTLSPVFDSISKQAYLAAFGEDDLKDVDLTRVVALGGVTAELIEPLRRTGFGGGALLGDVWLTEDGKERLLKLLLMRNFGLQFITDGRTVRETVDQALTVMSGGCRWIQVRMKESDPAEAMEALQELRPYCEDAGATLLVDDHYMLTEYCHGVHLGQEDERVSTVRRAIAPEKIIGLTVNNIDQIRASRDALPDYYGVGPFRLTSTKKRLAPVLGSEGYRRLSPELQRPFVAIGGIREQDIPELLDCGASGIAMSSCLTRAKDTAAETEGIVKIIKETKGKYRYGE